MSVRRVKNVREFYVFAKDREYIHGSEAALVSGHRFTIRLCLYTYIRIDIFMYNIVGLENACVTRSQLCYDFGPPLGNRS